MKHKHKHKKNCECMVCNLGFEAYRKHEDEQIKKYGFVTRYIVDEPYFPNHINYITVGLDETLKHLNFQICLPCSPQCAHEIFWVLVREIEKGKKFEVGPMYEDILGNDYKLKFILARENGRDVLRLILPNPEGTYTGEIYEAQFTKLNGEEEDKAKQN